MHAKATYKVTESVAKCAVESGRSKNYRSAPLLELYPLALLARYSRSGPSSALYHYTAHRWKLRPDDFDFRLTQSSSLSGTNGETIYLFALQVSQSPPTKRKASLVHLHLTTTDRHPVPRARI